MVGAGRAGSRRGRPPRRAPRAGPPGALRATAFTTVPAPGRETTYPSATSWSYASTTTRRVTPRSAASARVDGSRVPGGQPPAADRRPDLLLDLRAQTPRPRTIEHEVQIRRSGPHLFDSYLDLPGSTGVPYRHGMRSALWVPLFDELADPRRRRPARRRGRGAGWHGVFVWDHLAWRPPVRAVADPWITLAAAATATERVLLGPMVTPLARRRPAKLARETATLDLLSGGRLVLGVGLGSDRFGREFSATGDECDDRRRGAMLDEALAVLDAAWSGGPVRHRGEHYVVDDLTFLPRPAHRIPVWVAGFPGSARPRRRAATRDGFFPVNLEHPDELAAAIDGARDLPATSPLRWPGLPRAPTSPRSPPPARPGGSPTSTRRQSPWTRCAACCGTARRDASARAGDGVELVRARPSAPPPTPRSC